VKVVKEHIRHYWDSRAKTYDNSPGHVTLPEIWKDFLSEVFEERRRILDVGTGTGFISLILAELGHEVVGIDLSKGMLEVAREKAKKFGLDVEFRIGDAENLPFEDESFDAVVCRHLLWTLPNPLKAVGEWRRVVRDGGKVVAIDGSWFGRFSLKRLIGRIGVALYERRNPLRSCYSQEINKMLPLYSNLSPDRVVDIFEKAGLSDVSVKDLNWIREVMLRNQPIIYRLAWGSRGYFMVGGFRKRL